MSMNWDMNAQDRILLSTGYINPLHFHYNTGTTFKRGLDHNIIQRLGLLALVARFLAGSTNIKSGEGGLAYVREDKTKAI